MKRLSELKLLTMPLPSQDEQSELCRVCNRRRGEHQGPRGVHCPDGDTFSSASVFIGSGEYQDAPQHVKEREHELDARMRGLVPVFRAHYGRPDKNTGTPAIDGFVLAGFRRV